MVRKQAAQRYRDRVESRQALEDRRETNKDLPRDIYDVDDVFHTITQSDIDIAKVRQAGKSKWIVETKGTSEEGKQEREEDFDGVKVWKDGERLKVFPFGAEMCLYKSPNRIHLYTKYSQCTVYVFMNSRNSFQYILPQLFFCSFFGENSKWANVFKT